MKEYVEAIAPAPPELVTNKGTIRLRPADAAGVPDHELRDLVGAALGG